MEKRHDVRNILAALLLLAAGIFGFFALIGAEGPTLEEVYCDGFDIGMKTAQVRALQSGVVIEEVQFPPCAGPQTDTEDAATLFCEGAADGYVTILQPLLGPPPANYKADYVVSCVEQEIPQLYYKQGAGSKGGGVPPKDL